MLLEIIVVGGGSSGLRRSLHLCARAWSFPGVHLTRVHRWTLICCSVGLRKLLQRSASSFEKHWVWLTPRRSPRAGPPCFAKRLSSSGSMSCRSVWSGRAGGAGRTVRRSNSRRARGVSHSRDKLSQKSLRRLVLGDSKWSVTGSASAEAFLFRLRDAEASSEDIEERSCVILNFTEWMIGSNEGRRMSSRVSWLVGPLDLTADRLSARCQAWPPGPRVADITTARNLLIHVWHVISDAVHFYPDDPWIHAIEHDSTWHKWEGWISCSSITAHAYCPLVFFVSRKSTLARRGAE